MRMLGKRVTQYASLYSITKGAPIQHESYVFRPQPRCGGRSRNACGFRSGVSATDAQHANEPELDEFAGYTRAAADDANESRDRNTVTVRSVVAFNDAHG